MVNRDWSEYEPRLMGRRGGRGRTAGALLGALAFVLALGGATAAQAPTRSATPPSAAEGQTFGDWKYECQALNGGQACALSQTLVSNDSKKAVAKFNLGRDPQSGVVYLAVMVPLGLDLAAGIVGAIDESGPFAYQLETCLAVGCIARVPVDAALMKALKSGKTLKLGFRARGAQQATVLPGSLAGMTAGVAAASLE